jgi:adenine/guanine phosphoribosyltransferase-like PRPP-binding protein
MYPPITLARFQAARNGGAKRICFSSTHRTALKPDRNGRIAGYLNLPFVESIGKFLPWDLFPNKKGMHGGYYRSIIEKSEYDEIEGWIQEHGGLVFIKSALNSAVATCEHYTDSGRSKIGELEREAKYDGSVTARNKLVQIFIAVFDKLYRAKKIDAVVSVPPSTAGSTSLPNRLAAELAKHAGLPDLTGSIAWSRVKPSIKELPVDQKWAALEQVGLTIHGGFEGQNVLLIDDMYQSGATVHFVASALRDAGADDIHMLAVSKGRRDTDNQ